MKKFAMFVGLALVMLATSCTTDTTDVNLNGAKVTLGVSLDQTRTYMGELNNGQYPVLWSEGDQILVNNKVVAVPAQYAGKASLEVAVDAAEAYNVAYPADLIYNNELTISEVQKYVDGSFAVGSGVMVGYSTTATGVALKNLYGYLKFTVTGAANVNAVTVIAEGGESISGTYAIDYQNATITPLAGKDIIRVTEVAAKDGVATVVVAVPAGEYSKGFAVKVKDNANGVMVKSLKGAGGVVEAGTVYAMPEVAYAATATETEITTAAELQAALAQFQFEVIPDELPHLRLGADIDLAGVEFTPAADFYGVFDGQGYAIKNWNTSRALFIVNHGTVKNIVIDASCTLTAPSEGNNVALIVEDNEEPGIVAGCVNHGNVTVTDVSAVGRRIGGVVGVSYGIVHDCINHGKIDVTSNAVNNNQYVGGVVGYTNTNAGTKEALGADFLANCINYGEVKVLFPCLPKNAFVGGVLGGTQTAESAKAVYQGQIVDCLNYGNVSYRFEVLNTGTYANVGGVVGYSQANMSGCDNHGKVSYTTPTDPTAGGTRAAAGGVVACNLYGLENCNNYGELYVEGVWAAGGAGKSGAGSQAGSSMGGVVGCAGLNGQISAEYPTVGCNNYGKINLNVACIDGGGTAGYFAGVIGYTSNAVSDCHNYGDTDITAYVANTYMAGVVGYTQYGNVDNLSNNADVNLHCLGVKSASRTVYMAGVVGRSLTITNCVNNGAATMVVDPCDIVISTLYTGGVAGYADVKIENSTLNAAYSLTTADNQSSLRCAGIVGQVKTGTAPFNSVVNCNTTENASVTLNTKNTKANYTGGIIGSCNNGIDGCTNKATINVNTLEPNTGTAIYYVGGICGNQKETLNNCHNEGNITVDHGNSTCPLYAGTLVGKNHTSACIVKDCTNSGNLTIINTASTDQKIGVFGGDNPADDASAVTYENCTNTGVVTVNGAELGGAVEALSIDGKQWQLPEAIVMQIVGASTVGVADLGVSAPGQLIVGASLEPVYGPDAAGQWQIMITVAYTVEVTDATSGKIVLMQTNMFDEVTKTELPYKNLTADSVTIDFTNMGIGGEAVCTLYTENAPLAGGGGIAM